ncbi:MAG: tetratricopeptide repeat protein, partial [Candidatus Odinarchaeota archaeon]
KEPSNPAEAISVIEKYFPEEEISRNNFDVKIALAECYIATNDFEKTDKLLKDIQKNFPNNSQVLSIFAKYKKAMGKIGEVESYLFEALKYADELNKQIISLNTATFYYEHELYDKAIPYYERIVNCEVNNNALKSYLYCLYRSSDKEESYPKCLNICKEVRKKHGVSKFVSEIEAAIQEELGNLKEASGLYLDLSKIEPQKYTHKLRYGLIVFRRGYHSKAVDILKDIKDKVGNDPIALMSIAEIFDYMGIKQEAIILAYKALRAAPDNPQIHLAYIRLFLFPGEDKDEFLTPVAIEKNTIVVLKVDGERKSYTLIDSSESIPSEAEISINSDLGKILLGHKVGDKINLKQDSSSPEEMEIVEIKSKYVGVFQDSIQNFNTRFLKEKGLQKIKVDKEFKNIFKILDEASKRASQISEFYKDRRLTIGATANLLGRNLFEAWAGLISIPDLNLRCASGTLEEQRQEMNIAVTSQKVVVDLIALFTLAYLEILDVIPKLFQDIY